MDHQSLKFGLEFFPKQVCESQWEYMAPRLIPEQALYEEKCQRTP
jgi:hypothetical protein